VSAAAPEGKITKEKIPMGNYFIKIEDAPDLRRKILETSKAGLRILHDYQQFKVKRAEKLTLMSDLRQQLRELNLLINRVEALLPEMTEAEAQELRPASLPPLSDAQPPKKGAAQKGKPSSKIFIASPKRTHVTEVPVGMPDLSAQVKERPKPKPLTELERLERALATVEGKLENI
jgi:hypothetical protein